MEKNQESKSYQALLDAHDALQDKNNALKDEVQTLRARLAEAEELRRAISEGDLDALVIPGPAGELIFTLDSTDQAYRVLVETMNEGTATLASDGTILYCNRRFAELLRMNPQAIVSTSIYRFITPESASKFNALLGHKKDMGEITLQTEGGASLPVYISISLIQVSGSPNAWCLVVTDLTEQKKNEEIVAAEYLARSIIEQAGEGIAVCDTSGKITHFSNTITRICECDSTFHRFEDLLDLRFSEGVDTGGSILPVSSALNGSSIIGMEAIFKRKDSRNLHLLLNSGPLKNDNSEIIGCVVTLTDITERKRAEEALREAEETARQRLEEIEDLYHNAPVGLCVLDRELRWVRINERLAEINDFPAAAHIGKRVRDLMPQLADVVEPEMFRILETGQPRLDLEVISETPARPGVKRSWLEQWLPITDAKGQVTGLSIVVEETTERKRNEAMREAIASINQIIHSTLDFDKIMKQTVSEAARVVGSDSAAISLRACLKIHLSFT